MKPTNSKDLKGFLELLAAQQTQACSLATQVQRAAKAGAGRPGREIWRRDRQTANGRGGGELLAPVDALKAKD